MAADCTVMRMAMMGMIMVEVIFIFSIIEVKSKIRKVFYKNTIIKYINKYPSLIDNNFEVK
jgi:hypothetical protein